MLAFVDEACAAGARRDQAATSVGVSARTLERWRAQPVAECVDHRRGPRRAPANRLTASERTRVLAVANSPEFRDMSPKQIVPRLAERGRYVASESTFYRVLRAEGMQHHRGRSRRPSPRPRAHVADGPWQVASWDITYLRSHVRGVYFYLYLVEDVWSRKILGAEVHAVESADLSAELVAKLHREAALSGIDLAGWVLHADNGGPMKGATMLAKLQQLGVVPSFSRPRVSDDNPFAEALFKTLKYCPAYPTAGFASLTDARAWVAQFTTWYNDQHRHSGIGYVAPSDRHCGRDFAVLARRRATYARAHARHPERWARLPRPWDRPTTITLNPEPRQGVVQPRGA